jgi:hypothetical protein
MTPGITEPADAWNGSVQLVPRRAERIAALTGRRLPGVIEFCLRFTRTPARRASEGSRLDGFSTATYSTSRRYSRRPLLALRAGVNELLHTSGTASHTSAHRRSHQPDARARDRSATDFQPVSTATYSTSRRYRRRPLLALRAGVNEPLHTSGTASHISPHTSAHTSPTRARGIAARRTFNRLQPPRTRRNVDTAAAPCLRCGLV